MLALLSAAMTAPAPRTTARLAAFAALLAMCLRIALPLLHSGHDCSHHAPPLGGALEPCACGVVHTDQGDVAPGGEHQDAEGAPTASCLACQLEDQSPGGSPLQVLVAVARPHAPLAPAALRERVRAPSACVRPPPRAPPIRTA